MIKKTFKKDPDVIVLLDHFGRFIRVLDEVPSEVVVGGVRVVTYNEFLALRGGYIMKEGQILDNEPFPCMQVA